MLAQASTTDFKSRIEEHRKLDATTGVGTLVIMDLAKAADTVCTVDQNWPERVDEFTADNALTEDESTLLGYYCIVYGHGVIEGADQIVKVVN